MCCTVTPYGLGSGSGLVTQHTINGFNAGMSWISSSWSHVNALPIVTHTQITTLYWNQIFKINAILFMSGWVNTIIFFCVFGLQSNTSVSQRPKCHVGRSGCSAKRLNCCLTNLPTFRCMWKAHDIAIESRSAWGTIQYIWNYITLFTIILHQINIK